ncbi:MAG TPA: PKD domain-containing protein [Thermoanaerobaculia bacterium]
MKSAVFVLLLTLAFAVQAQEECYWLEPDPGMRMTMSCQGPACPHGTPVQLGLEPQLTGTQPPYIFYYELQPCDEVTWDFGDGSPMQTAPRGTAAVTHTWAAPGNYTISATVRNEAGSYTHTTERVIASDPSTVSWPTMKPIAETAGSVAIQLKRKGGLANRVSLALKVAPPWYWPEPAIAPVTIPIVFEPGETAHVVTLPVRDNALYDGLRHAQINLVEPEGGLFLQNGWLEISDDEPRPTLTCHDVSVREGDAGRTRVSIPCTLSAPLGSYLNLFGALNDGTADRNDYSWNTRGTQIVGGQLSGKIEFDVYGDTEIEPREQLTFRYRYFSPWEPLTGPPATVTILNDDAELRPSRRHAGIGEQVEFRLVPGEYFEQPTALPLRSSDPAVLTVPASVLLAPGAEEVTFVAETLAEGAAAVEVDLGTRVLSADLMVHDARAVVASDTSLTLPAGGTRIVTLSLTPASIAPVTVHLTADAKIVNVPASVTIPPGGSVDVAVRGAAAGYTAIGITSAADGIAGTSVLVDVIQGRRRRSSSR